jgi:hypothetical protein
MMLPAKYGQPVAAMFPIARYPGGMRSMPAQSAGIANAASASASVRELNLGSIR